MEVKLEDIRYIYENEIRKNVKNKKKIFDFERNKLQYFLTAKYILENNQYRGGKYCIFLIHEPKERVIMSQNVFDKLINHYITKSILIPKLSKYLNDRNCATRKNMGTAYALKLVLKDIEGFKKYKEFYFLKLDIKKYFYNISHEKLKELIKDDLNEEEFKLISTIIDSTDKEYVNGCIEYLENRYNTKLPKYKKGFGLPIGNLSSQFLAVFYLSKLHHFIIHNLHLKMICYMDDYIFIHESKEYLEKCLEIIRNMLEKEYELSINDKKTFIVSSRIGLSFLGYIIRVINGRTIVTLTRDAKNPLERG